VGPTPTVVFITLIYGYGTGSVKIWKTCHKIAVDIYGYFYSVLRIHSTSVAELSRKLDDAVLWNRSQEIQEMLPEIILTALCSITSVNFSLNKSV